MVNQGQEILIGGYDTGNNKLKVSFLDAKSNIQSFAIPTVIAEAPATKVDLKSSKEENKVDVDFLHLHVHSDSLNNVDNNKTWYVGAYAKNRDNKLEPTLNNEGKSEVKLSSENKKLHLIPLLSGMAVAALRSGKENVIVPFSGGVPIEDFKTRGEEQILDMLRGKHVIRFVDGVYQGKQVQIEINEGTINVEGVHSILGLQFDIKDGKIVEIKEIANKMGDNFVINDLGAGTTDRALFEDATLNKELSTNDDIGTNKYIDQLANEIENHEKFEPVSHYKKNNKIYKTREELIQNLIDPQVKKLIAGGKADEMKFITQWGPIKNVDVTDIVIKAMKDYAQEQSDALMDFWMKTNAEKMVLVGGGVLFGYIGLKGLQEEYSNDFILPADLTNAAFFTSRSYLIANYLKQLAKEGAFS